MLAATWPFEEGEKADQLNASTKHVVASRKEPNSAGRTRNGLAEM